MNNLIQIAYVDFIHEEAFLFVNMKGRLVIKFKHSEMYIENPSVEVFRALFLPADKPLVSETTIKGILFGLVTQISWETHAFKAERAKVLALCNGKISQLERMNVMDTLFKNLVKDRTSQEVIDILYHNLILACSDVDSRLFSYL